MKLDNVMKNYLAISWVVINFMVLHQLSVARGNISNQKEKDQKTEFNVVVAKPMNLNGYTQVRYQAREDKNDSFDIRRARFSLKGKIGKQLSYKIQTEFGGLHQKLLDAELTFAFHPIIKLSAGQFKIPFSHENLLSSAGLATINRSQAVEALTARGKDVLGNQSGRDIGLKLSGSFGKMNDGPLFDYVVGVFNGSGINTADLNEQKDIVGRLVIHSVKNIAFGGSYYAGKYTLASALGKTQDRERAGAEFTYSCSLVSIMTEYIKGKDNTITKAGLYVQAGCFVIPRKLQGVLKYDNFDPNVDVSDNSATVYTIGMNLYFNEKSKLQIDYELKDEQGAQKENNVIIVQLQFEF